MLSFWSWILIFNGFSLDDWINVIQDKIIPINYLVGTIWWTLPNIFTEIEKCCLQINMVDNYLDNKMFAVGFKLNCTLCRWSRISFPHLSPFYYKLKCISVTYHCCLSTPFRLQYIIQECFQSDAVMTKIGF